jgi:predicted kinase
MATLHFIAGRAGAGKTTLARQLGRELPAVVICEDAWVSKLADPITSFGDFLKATTRLHSALEPHIVELLRLGNHVVLDFAGNTPASRQWVRSIFESAPANHVLHYLTADEATCRERVRQRNVTRPEGIFFGVVTDALLDEVNPHFVPPGVAERFNVLVRRD